MSFDWMAIVSALPDLLRGLELTIVIAAAGLAGGLALGGLAGIVLTYGGLISRIPATAYVALIRGTPIVVQVMFIYFALPLLLELRLSATNAAVITIAINAGAYIAEIIRGALEGVPKGLGEAGLSMGLPFWRVLVDVIGPLAFRRALPALGNQVINSVKDTSFFLVIGVAELTRQGQEIMAENFHAVEIWCAVAVIYLLLISAIAGSLRILERVVRIP